MMRNGVAMTALAVALATAGPSAWAQVQTGVAGRSVAAPSLARLLAAPRLDPAGVDALYRRAVLEGSLAALEAEIAAAAHRTDAAPVLRARALLVGALLTWQDGRIDAAMTAAEAALAIDPGYDAQLLRARLLDATGRPAQAIPFYAAAAQASSSAEDRAALQLRAAIAAADEDPKEVMPLIAQAAPRERRGIAVLLGLFGDPAGALATYRPAIAGAPPFSAQIRMAQWAIAAKDRGAATDAAWAASRVGSTPADRRYALALLAEAFRDARDLNALLAFLRDKPADPDVTQLRIDTLVELGRLDEALTLVRATADPALRAQLPGLLDLAGQREALIAEYERRIAREPAALRWYDALAVLLLSTGDRDGATGVFRRLFAANPGNTALLTDATRRMIAMGLSDVGLTLLGGSGAGRSTAIRLFQFESEAAQGRTGAAAATLAGLDQSLPARDPQRIALADGYERLGRGGDALRILLALEKAGHVFGFDDQLHVVRLQRDAAQDVAALARLLDLWFVTRLPAQRGFVEAQIVEVARRVDRIDAVSDQVRARIATGDDRGVELFVVLRIARNDPAGARAAVEAFARTAGGSAARLQRVAALYRRLNDHARYRATLTQLTAADPANAATYLQQLVRDVAIPSRGSDAALPSAELDALLARLAAVRRSDPAEARRFAAGVYGGAGQVERAVRLYREAAAMSATDRDAVLGLVNLLNANGARAQAIALLQYRAEFAATPADQAQAIDALAGVLAATSPSGGAEQSPQYAAVRLLWARRRLTWRLARGDDDAGLYDQLADLSEQIGDTRMQRRAREASLAVEGTQRAATLRQLIALSSAGAGNDDAKARYGRRLTALRQAYPADVYAELAAAMLMQRDLAGAERAFALIEDIPGLVNVDALRADAYLASGYLPRALAGYSRALLRDRGDAGLILKTAILQEQVGDREVARALYWQSLRDTVQRLPVVAAAGQGPVASPFADSMLEGLLFTWPGDPAKREPLRAALEAMTREATDGAATATWSGAVRAQRLLTIARQLAASGRDPAVLAAIDPLVVARFAGDAGFVRDRAAFRNLTGQPAAMAVAAAPSDGDWGTAALAMQAQGGTNPELRLSLALDRGDDGELATLFEQAARAEVAKRDALGPTDFVYESSLNAMLMMIAGQLPAARLRTVVLEPLDKVGNRETALFDLFRTAPDRLALMERAAGGPLLSAERLATLIRTRFNSPSPRRVSLRRRSTPPPDAYAVMIGRFSLDQQVALYAGLAEDGQRTGAEPILVAPLERQVLRQTLSTGQQARMTDAIRQVMSLDLPVAGRAGRLFALTDVPVANRPVVVAGARALSERSPQDRVVPDAIEALFRGDRTTALEILLAAGETPDGGDYAPAAIARLLADDYRRQGAAFVALPNPGTQARAQFYRRYVLANPTGFGGTAVDARTYIERLVSLEPDNGIYLAQLLARLWGEGDRGAVIARLAPFVAAHPDDRDAAALLQMVQLLAGQDAAATAVAARSRIDVNDPDTLADLVTRMQAARDSASAGNGAPSPTFLMLFGYAYDTAKREKPNLRGVAAIAARNRVDPAAPAAVAADLLDPVVRPAADPANLAATMRGVWRRSVADPDKPEDTAEAKRGQLLERLTDVGLSVVPPGKPDGNAPAAALTATPAIVGELEEEAHLIDPVVRQQQQPLYDLIAAGALRQGTADRRIDELFAALAGGGIDSHGLQLLATLTVRSGRVLDAGQVTALRRAVERMPTMSARERILWSQVLARSGQMEAARQWLEAAVLQILYVDRADLAGGARLATFDTVVESLGTWTDRAAAVAAHAALSARIERERTIMPPDDVPGSLPPLVPTS
ncbi:hypothetical protein [Sphingomonas sp. Leaf62]|uniref:hypothetical protein n=1 Tax=Sphingomonas sp. Leaf62 TaxID=1736228 RepID=UPI0006FF29E9|nr:hypothetical protein [Sphingomonas sp. Leaf62]KQN79762.1 hypothetical protein ASE91_13125 [Sphingomonas sp. Leaf62]